MVSSFESSAQELETHEYHAGDQGSPDSRLIPGCEMRLEKMLDSPVVLAQSKLFHPIWLSAGTLVSDAHGNSLVERAESYHSMKDGEFAETRTEHLALPEGGLEGPLQLDDGDGLEPVPPFHLLVFEFDLGRSGWLEWADGGTGKRLVGC